MAKLFSASAFVLISFFCSAASAGQDEGAISLLDRSGGSGISAPVPPAPEALPASGAQADMKLWNEYIHSNFGGNRAGAEQLDAKGAPGEAVETVDLPPLLNASFKSALTFRTSGNTVHISGAEAMNCQNGGSCSSNDKYFLLFTTDGGQTIFVRAKDVANALFMSGSKDIIFPGDGEKYRVKLNVKLTSPGQSRLKIEGPGKTAVDVSLDDLTAALAKKGHALNVGARHNLYYNSAVLQDSSGNGRFSAEKVLIFSPRGSDPNQTVKASEINSSGVLLPKVEKDFGFRIVNEKLEIYKL